MFKVRNKISGWGNYPVAYTTALYPSNAAEIKQEILDAKTFTARGNGRSYGDAAIGDCVLVSTQLDNIGEIDMSNNEITCQSGVLLCALIDYLIPKGYFLPVVPGTKHITIGGAVAADVHGKNHFSAGSFGRYVASFTLITEKGEELQCSPSNNEKIFYATLGGMGLTGFLVDVTLKLIPINNTAINVINSATNSLSGIFDCFTTDRNADYKIAWYDCFSGKGIYTSGNNVKDELPANSHLHYTRYKPVKPVASIPFTMSGWLINRFSIKLMNKIRFARTKFDETEVVPYNSFFFPLDAISGWNKMYGPYGFMQYQYAVSPKLALAATNEIFTTIEKAGHYCTLAVIKQLGSGNNESPLSFPMEGYTIALDFKNKPGIKGLLNLLDKIIMKYKGRIYLAKDACMNYDTMKAGYPDLDDFNRLIQQTNSTHKFNSAQCQRIGYLK